MTKQLSPTAKGLSILNTSSDIGRVLMDEIEGDRESTKASVFYLAQMALGQLDGFVQSDATLSDIVEYILLVGNAAARTRLSDIVYYLNIKGDTGSKNEQLYEKPNRDFRKLLRRVIINEDESPRRELDSIVDGVSGVFRASISGLQARTVSNPGKPRKSYVPPQVNQAARALLLNFPILQRVEVGTYQDIVNAIQIDSILEALDENYSRQIRQDIEARVSEIAQGRTNLRLQDTSELLLKARMAYLFSHGITAIAPKSYRKHISDRDLEAALLTGVVDLGLRKRAIDKRNGAERSVVEMYFGFGWREREFYRIHERFHSDEEGFGSVDEFNRYVAELAKKSGAKINASQQRLLYDSLRVLQAQKHMHFGLEGFFEAYGERIAEADVLTMLILSATAGLKADFEYLLEGGEQKKADLRAIKIESFDSSQSEHQRRSRRYEDSYAPLSSGRDIYLPPGDFKTVFNALATTYVNNVVLRKVKDESNYPLGHFLHWNSPAVFTETYQPQDVAVTRWLLDKYPVFSRLLVQIPLDVINGIVLSGIDNVNGHIQLDSTASITQNLFIRQCYLIGRPK